MTAEISPLRYLFPGSAGDLNNLQSGWRAFLDSVNALPSEVPLDPGGRAQVITDSILAALAANPELLNETLVNAARSMRVPPRDLIGAFDELARQTGVRLTNTDGSPRTMRDILFGAPASIGMKQLQAWVKSLPTALQQMLYGAAMGLVLAAEGVTGLVRRLNWQAELIKTQQGQIVLRLVPNNRGVAGQISGEWHFPINNKGQLEFNGRVATDGSRHFAAGLRCRIPDDHRDA
jgi:hypothetical protein